MKDLKKIKVKKIFLENVINFSQMPDFLNQKMHHQKRAHQKETQMQIYKVINRLKIVMMLNQWIVKLWRLGEIDQ